jgi:selenocysteine-specific elongation factor
MHIIGTAGHVDHGKSSLVMALTGTNPDRWIEEQVRGMTLDLGFAHLRFDDGVEAGIVDVPGHERFLHNMLAGAAGMELLLLAIAADDGVMPQTIEHLQILRYLNVKRTIVALTKADLVPANDAGFACRRVHEQLSGTIAGDAPIFAVSTVTNQNIDVLKSELHQTLASLDARDPNAPAYLPVDRVFALSGRGTIVTGTLMQGRITVGDTVSLEPSGIRARVRNLQVFGAPRDLATGGTRVALNLAGVDRAQIARGTVVADSSFAAHSQFDVSFAALPEALALLRRRTHVRAYIGSAEVLGTLVFDRVPCDERPTQAQLVLRERVLAFPGVRFVVRRVSPKTLLGGGEIAVPGGDVPVTLAADPVQAAIRAYLAARLLEPQSLAAIAFAANVREDVTRNAIDAMIERGEAIALARPLEYLDAITYSQVAQRIRDELEAGHAREPWAMGATSVTLSRALGIAEPLIVRLLAALASEGRIAAHHGYYATTSHQPRLSPEQRAFFEKHVPIDPSEPFLPVACSNVSALVKTQKIAGLSQAFDTLLVRGVLVKVGDSLYRAAQIEAAHARVEAFIADHQRMTMAEFRDLLGTSRKYAVPLLEWFDGRGITVRDGDYRTLRARKGAREQLV